jgi:hypothetical protein
MTTTFKIKKDLYLYGFPSNQSPILLDNQTIVYQSNLPILIDLAYTSERLPEIKCGQMIQVSQHAYIKICYDEDDEFEYISLISNRHEYTLYELAHAVVQAALTQKGSQDVWYTFKLIIEQYEDGSVSLSQECNH